MVETVSNFRPVRQTHFRYQASDSSSLQLLLLISFTLSSDAFQDNTAAFQIIELRVLSNWGHPEYTCLYRFRVHGEPVQQWRDAQTGRGVSQERLHRATRTPPGNTEHDCFCLRALHSCISQTIRVHLHPELVLFVLFFPSMWFDPSMHHGHRAANSAWSELHWSTLSMFNRNKMDSSVF